MKNERVLVGFETADDAGVYRLNDRQSLVLTVDFFTPIVDDPYCFGQIAAANALSDIYAMGGQPLTALSICCFPIKELEPAVFTEMLKGGMEKIHEAGAALVGGHSVEDRELKLGFAITGLVDNDKIVTNAGAKVGDKLILTKPLGVGILTTAIKKEKLTSEMIDRVCTIMKTLNKEAAALMVQYGAHAATDITGYGLLGHALEMARASGVTLEFWASQIPYIPETKIMAQKGYITGGEHRNWEFVKKSLTKEGQIPDYLISIILDPQTSGGLLIAVAEDKAEVLMQELQKAGAEYTSLIGQAKGKSEGSLLLKG